MASASGEPTTLAQFLRRTREQAVEQWQQELRKIPPAKRLELEALRDHVPALLDRVIESVERGTTVLDESLPEEHARTRADQGFSLEQIAEEYSILRAALFRLLESEPAPLEAGALLVLNEAIDHAVSRAVSRYHEMRARTLAALERLSQQGLSFDGDSMRDLLRRLLTVLLETMEDVDTVVIYLREWDRLVVRAATGLEASIEDRVSVAMGEGIAGTVAARQRPYFTSSAATDPLMKNPALVRAGIKALYAVPLIVGSDLVGVAKMGSRTASQYSADDRQLFEDMAQRAASLIAQRKLAEEREVFVGILSHDLRTPLNTIGMGASYIERRENLSETGGRVLQRMDTAAKRMQQMIRGLTDYTMMRFGGEFTIEPQVVDLSDPLTQLLEELRAQNPGHEIRVDMRGDLAGEWDRVRLEQLVTNLVNNAIAYGDPATPVALTADGTRESELTLTVHNEGPPIPPGLVPHVFEAFRRGRTQVGGIGLGLYIVRYVTLAHGGDVSVQSSADGGTTFVIRLPRWVRH